MNMRPGIVFGTKSRPGRLQDAPGRLEEWLLTTPLAENVAPNGQFGATLGPKMSPKSHF